MGFTYFFSDPSPGLEQTLTSVTYANTDGNTSAILPSTVVTISSLAFSTATVKPAMTSISCSGATGLITIGNSAFASCSVLTSITGISLVTSIGTSVFQDCIVLASFSWPSGALTINDSTFNGCRALTSITGINNVTRIGYGVFAQTALSSFSWLSGARIIESATFYYCRALTSITGIESVTSIGQQAFIGCTALTSFSWPSGAQIINNNTFQNCLVLSNFTVPSSVTTIGQDAFYNCTGLTTITLQRLLINNLTTLILNSFRQTTAINSTNYGSLTTMIRQGYTTGNLTTAGFNPAAITLAAAAAPCFKEDTKILTDKGYIPIQNLRKDDLVKTLLNDYKPIVMIGKREMFHLASNERIKDQLYKCSQIEYPEVFEDLIITGSHAILVDNFVSESQKEKVIEINNDTYVTNNKYRLPACVDDRASIYETPGEYTIYHLALEHDDYYSNYGIYANGLLVETCSKRYLKELSNMIIIE